MVRAYVEMPLGSCLKRKASLKLESFSKKTRKTAAGPQRVEDQEMDLDRLDCAAKDRRRVGVDRKAVAFSEMADNMVIGRKKKRVVFVPTPFRRPGARRLRSQDALSRHVSKVVKKSNETLVDRDQIKKDQDHVRSSAVSISAALDILTIPPPLAGKENEPKEISNGNVLQKNCKEIAQTENGKGNVERPDKRAQSFGFGKYGKVAVVNGGNKEMVVKKQTIATNAVIVRVETAALKKTTTKKVSAIEISVSKKTTRPATTVAAVQRKIISGRLVVERKKVLQPDIVELQKPKFEDEIHLDDLHIDEKAKRSEMAITTGNEDQSKSLSFYIPGHSGHIEKDDEINYSEYGEDILRHLLMSEKRFEVPIKFLEPPISRITHENRQLLVDWLIQVQVHEQLSTGAFQLSVALIDLYLVRRTITLDKFQLLGVACLLIASKYEDRYPPSMSQLIYLTDNTYTLSELTSMERLVLKTLAYQISVPTPVSFIDWFIIKTAAKDRFDVETHASLTALTGYILDAAAVDSCFSPIKPSVRAAAAVSLSACLVTFSNHFENIYTSGSTVPTPSMSIDNNGNTSNNNKSNNNKSNNNSSSNSQKNDNEKTGKLNNGTDYKQPGTQADGDMEMVRSSSFGATQALKVVRETVGVLSKVAQCSDEEIMSCIRMMIRALQIINSSKYQAAQVKYASDEYQMVSKDETLISSSVLSTASFILRL